MKPPADLRRLLLDVSLDLISEEGLEKLSLREIARRAGVSHQAPYHHFADREALLAEVVGEGFVLLRRAMLDALKDYSSPHARLGAIGQAYLGFALEHPAHFKLMFRSELVREERHDRTREEAGSAFDVLVSVVRDVAEREGDEGDARALVLACWALAHGLATLLLEGKLAHQYGADKDAQRAEAERVFELFGRLLQRGL